MCRKLILANAMGGGTRREEGREGEKGRTFFTRFKLDAAVARSSDVVAACLNFQIHVALLYDFENCSVDLRHFFL